MISNTSKWQATLKNGKQHLKMTSNTSKWQATLQNDKQHFKIAVLVKYMLQFDKFFYNNNLPNCSLSSLWLIFFFVKVTQTKKIRQLSTVLQLTYGRKNENKTPIRIAQHYKPTFTQPFTKLRLSDLKFLCAGLCIVSMSIFGH